MIDVNTLRELVGILRRMASKKISVLKLSSQADSVELEGAKLIGLLCIFCTKNAARACAMRV